MAFGDHLCRPNGWPMRRRSGCSGLVTSEAGAAGTIGLLGTSVTRNGLDVRAH